MNLKTAILWIWLTLWGCQETSEQKIEFQKLTAAQLIEIGDKQMIFDEIDEAHKNWNQFKSSISLHKKENLDIFRSISWEDIDKNITVIFYPNGFAIRKDVFLEKKDIISKKKFSLNKIQTREYSFREDWDRFCFKPRYKTIEE
jgi:hypothetical protein